MNSQPLPLTRRAQLYRKALSWLWVASIAGIALTLNSAASTLMDAGFNPARVPGKGLALAAIILAGWSLICWISYRGSRRNLAPPGWAYLAVPLFGWAAILVNRFG